MALLTDLRQMLLARYQRVRHASLAMCEPLWPEDYRLQPMEDVSPPWWNLGHTSWFFVRNVLEPFSGRSEPEDAEYDYVLNSYYASLGQRLPRGQRGSLSRPTTEDIYHYRVSVDDRVQELIDRVDESRLDELAERITIGLQHEQQHQELFYTEIKYILAQPPWHLRSVYAPDTQDDSLPTPAASAFSADAAPGRFVEFSGGLLEFGNLEGGWCWDNELPVHRAYLAPFALGDRLVTNREYLEFIEDGGYRNPLLWLDNGWAHCQQSGWQAPLYWQRLDQAWWTWTLGGMRPLALDEPVCHVSFYEADAFARWVAHRDSAQRGTRLPTEREWELAARRQSGEFVTNAFLDAGHLHPTPSRNETGLDQLAGVLWQWTQSYYEPYPGYRPFEGPLAEYNGKFMDNQRVLRGGSCVTWRDHFRISYRNFWAPATRFQFTGIRLARDILAPDTEE